MIPKKIYQTWYSNDIPIVIKESIQNMLSLNSTYEYSFYNDDDIESFVKDNFDGEIYSSFKALNIGAAKADLWRYLILYKNGGIYLDMDSQIYSNLDSLIENTDKAVITRENNNGLFVQWCLMFEKNHPILEKTIEKCVHNISTRKTDDILSLTGPLVFSESVREVLSPLDINIWDSDDAVISEMMENPIFDDIRCKIYNRDYNGYCKFKHPSSNSLYIERLSWREQQKITNTFKCE